MATTTEEGRRRAELVQFLRTRRERLSPTILGVSPSERRRTPGLRREELALLAGVSVSWYTWLEQGRAITVSAQTLESLARALRLSAEERAYLFLLARGEVPTPGTSMITPSAALEAVETSNANEAIDGSIQQVLDALGCYPAYVVNAHWNVVAWNTAACRVFVDFANLSGRERNLLWLLFTSLPLRRRYEEWEQVARHMLALFRLSTAQSLGEGWYTEIVAALWGVSAEFRAWWPQHDILGTPHDAKVVNHPLVGRLALRSNPLQVALAPDSWMLVYTPLEETDTLAKLQRLMTLPLSEIIA